MEKIGLNNAWHITKGVSFLWRVKNLFWGLRYAWQRAWRGYDDVEIFDLGFSFFQRMPVLLRQFKECNISLFYDDEHNRDMTEEETNAVLDKMIWYFDNCDEETVVDRLYPDIAAAMEDDDLSSLDQSIKRLTWDDHKAIGDEVRRCRAEALRLFSQYCCQLWY